MFKEFELFEINLCKKIFLFEYSELMMMFINCEILVWNLNFFVFGAKFGIFVASAFVVVFFFVCIVLLMCVFG